MKIEFLSFPDFFGRFHFLHRLRYKGLSAEPGVYGHNQQKIDLVQKWLNLFERGRWTDGQSRRTAAISYRPGRRSDITRRLHMKGNVPDERLKPWKKMVRSFDH